MTGQLLSYLYETQRKVDHHYSRNLPKMEDWPEYWVKLFFILLQINAKTGQLLSSSDETQRKAESPHFQVLTKMEDWPEYLEKVFYYN